MTDIIIKNTHNVNMRGSNDLLQDFHASLTPYIIRRVDYCTKIIHSKVVMPAYPFRYMQVQEAINALRLKSQPFSGNRKRTARTVSIIWNDNLYHSPLCLQRIMIDPREDVDDVVFSDEDFLTIVALGGHHYQFDIDDITGWRVDDSWEYMDDNAEERTLGHVLNDIDMELQMPYGFVACLAQRQEYSGKPASSADSSLTALFEEYRNKLGDIGIKGEVTARRIQLMPVDPSITGCEGPCAFIDPDADVEHCIALDEHYLRINKIDDLPFVLRRNALQKYQVQNIRNALSEEEYDGCGDTEVTVTDEFIL